MPKNPVGSVFLFFFFSSQFLTPKSQMVGSVFSLFLRQLPRFARRANRLGAYFLYFYVSSQDLPEGQTDWERIFFIFTSAPKICPKGKPIGSGFSLFFPAEY